MGAYYYRDFEIPGHMVAALMAYIERGEIPGDFLQCIISNDLVGACGRADEHNIRNLPAYASFLYNEAPSTCWGSREKMAAYSLARTEAMRTFVGVDLAKGPDATVHIVVDADGRVLNTSVAPRKSGGN